MCVPPPPEVIVSSASGDSPPSDARVIERATCGWRPVVRRFLAGNRGTQHRNHRDDRKSLVTDSFPTSWMCGRASQSSFQRGRMKSLGGACHAACHPVMRTCHLSVRGSTSPVFGPREPLYAGRDPAGWTRRSASYARTCGSGAATLRDHGPGWRTRRRGGGGGGGRGGQRRSPPVTLTADAALSPRLGPKEAPAGSVPSAGAPAPALPAAIAERYESLGLLRARRDGRGVPRTRPEARPRGGAQAPVRRRRRGAAAARGAGAGAGGARARVQDLRGRR